MLVPSPSLSDWSVGRPARPAYTEIMLRSSLAVVVVAAVCVSATVSAHLAVVKTLPAAESTISAPPDRVAVWFSQAPSSRLSRLELRGPNGDDVIELDKPTVSADDQSVAARIPTTLTPGSYTVAWRTAGDDGHVMRGTFTFSVQPAR